MHFDVAGGHFYRGLNEEHSDVVEAQSAITWLTVDHDYASLYAISPSTIYEYDVEPHKSFNFGFRSLHTFVKLDDIASRLNNEIMRLYQCGSIDRESAVDIHNSIDELKRYPNQEMNKVWSWWQIAPEILSIVKAIGYQSISALEGLEDDKLTIGVLDKKIANRLDKKEESHFLVTQPKQSKQLRFG